MINWSLVDPVLMDAKVCEAYSPVDIILITLSLTFTSSHIYVGIYYFDKPFKFNR